MLRWPNLVAPAAQLHAQPRVSYKQISRYKHWFATLVSLPTAVKVVCSDRLYLAFGFSCLLSDLQQLCDFPGEHEACMTDLKRKRSPDEPASTQTASVAETSYFHGLPDGLAELADVKLVVQGHSFPVHSYILRESPILVAAISAARDEKQRVCQVPLSGEKTAHVLLVLKYLYKDDPAIQTIGDGQALATFAHKYSMIKLHKLSEAYLVEKLRFTNTTVFGWAELAERFELNLLLAHCEQFIILSFHSMSPSEKKVSSISQSSLLRVMDGLAGKEVEEFDWTQPRNSAHMYFCMSCNWLHVSLSNGRCPGPCQQNTDYNYTVCTVDKTVLRGLRTAVVPSVECLLNWHKNGDNKQ